MNKVYYCRCGHTETTESLAEKNILPVCQCGEDMVTWADPVASRVLARNLYSFDDEAEARMEMMMLHGTEG